MLVVDASCLVEVLVGGPHAAEVARRLAEDEEHLAPHVVDVEVLGVVRRAHLRGELDATAAAQALDDLVAWPGERVGHAPLMPRAWALRDTVRAPDAVYVALAEAVGAPLLTLDRRLARASGPTCTIEVVEERRRG